MGRSWYALLALVAAPLAAQDAPRPLLVHPGATVRVRAPSLGPGVYLGKFATANVRGTPCYGAAVTLPGANGSPSLILLKGISRLEVDRRTNVDAIVMGLEPPADSDWQAIDLARLRAQDIACAITGKPAP
ncbi:MAG TPA: hypothetical protein VG692_18495 [Gemmatimonadales bacterium]|nr:hypothetical protein [Gemmatimonadales bacterium]